MNRVIIDKPSDLRIQSGVLLIDEELKIPLNAIDFLIINAKAKIDLRRIAKLASEDIALLVVTSNPKDFIHIQKRYFKNASLKEAQYNSLAKRLSIAKAILKAKIENSYNTLLKLGVDIEKRRFLKDLDAAKSMSSILGIEGSLARVYFSAYFTLFPRVLAKGSRTKNPPGDPVNAMLSYIYTIFYFEIATWLNFYGFEPLIGYLHTSFRDHLALASDILEFLRADIDLFVAKLFLEEDFGVADFTKKRNSVLLTQNGRKKLWRHLKPFMETKEKTIKAKIAHLRDMIENDSLSAHKQE